METCQLKFHDGGDILHNVADKVVKTNIKPASISTNQVAHKKGTRRAGNIEGKM